MAKPALLCPSATVVYFSWIKNAIDRLTMAVKKNVSHFSHSVVATEALKNKQQQMNITFALPGGILRMKCLIKY